MKSYNYSFKDKSGQLVYAQMNAMSMNQVRAILKEKKIIPLKLKEEVHTSIFGSLFTPKKVPADQIVLFSQLFAGAIRSGLSVKDALRMLAQQIQNPLMRSRLGDIILEIDGGTALSSSFAKHSDIFPTFYYMLLKAGEASGNLADVLEYLAAYLERINGLKKELIGVFIYPGIVLTLTCFLVTAILLFVAPTFKGVFAQSKLKLPLPTQILFAMSDIVKNYYILILILIGLGVGFYFMLKRTKAGQKSLDRLTLNLPLIGPIIKETLMLRFVKTMDILVNNNVPILQALQILEEGTSNLCLKDIIIQMRRDVSKGLPIANALFDYQSIISPMVAYSVSMGEKSGRLGETLNRVGVFIDKNLVYAMKKLSSRLDPLLTMGLGGMVLFIALSIYLPMFDMIASAAG